MLTWHNQTVTELPLKGQNVSSSIPQLQWARQDWDMGHFLKYTDPD